MTVIIVIFLPIILLDFNGLQNVNGEFPSKGPLHLTPLIESGQIDEARKQSSVDPKLFAGVHSHSGFITVNETYKWHTFFWFFPVENKPLDTTPWIIWLQGGPGGTSLYGLFYELGPIEYNSSNDTASRMQVTWGSDYSMLFIDNPVGSGFSYSEDDAHFVTEDEQVGTSLSVFLQQFLQIFPELQQAPLFIAGESYAGKYIPHFVYKIHHSWDKSIPINMKGLSIGNGWIDPPSLLHYSDLAVQFGILDFEQGEKLAKLEDETRNAWHDGQVDDYIKNMQIILNLTAYELVTNPSNIMKDNRVSYAANYENFLNRKDVQSALHIGRKWPFKSQNASIFSYFVNTGIIFLPAKSLLEDLLEHYAVLCYNGQLDFGVGYALSEHTYRALNWSGAEAYLLAERKPIPSRDPEHTLDPIGYVKSAGNFMEAMIRAAGHMVPTDQPRAAKQLIDIFIDKFK